MSRNGAYIKKCGLSCYRVLHGARMAGELPVIVGDEELAVDLGPAICRLDVHWWQVGGGRNAAIC